MTVKDLADKQLFKEVHMGGSSDTEISRLFCCDLLSVAMGKAPADGCWVTVMANLNSLAVASLTDVACIVNAEGMEMDESFISKAVMQDITVFHTDEPVFDAALKVQRLLDA